MFEFGFILFQLCLR